MHWLSSVGSFFLVVFALLPCLASGVVSFLLFLRTFFFLRVGFLQMCHLSLCHYHCQKLIFRVFLLPFFLAGMGRLFISFVMSALAFVCDLLRWFLWFCWVRGRWPDAVVVVAPVVWPIR